MDRGRARLDGDALESATRSFQLAHQLCGPCRDFHALWPYTRMSRVHGGVDVGRAELHAMLRERFGGGSRRVLIAGAADAGLLELVSEAGSGFGIAITVIDLCETPLEVCRGFAARRSLSVDTRRMDLVDLDSDGDFDVVLAHFLLRFMAPEERLNVMQRFRRSLRKDGRLIFSYFTSRPVTAELALEYRLEFPGWVLTELERMNVPLPEEPAAFRNRLESYVERRAAREGEFADPAQADALVEASGLKLERRLPIEQDLINPARRFADRHGKRAHLAVATP